MVFYFESVLLPYAVENTGERGIKSPPVKCKSKMFYNCMYFINDKSPFVKFSVCIYKC